MESEPLVPKRIVSEMEAVGLMSEFEPKRQSWGWAETWLGLCHSS